MNKRKLFEVEVRAKISEKKLKLPADLAFISYLEDDRYFRYSKDLEKQWIVRIRKRNDKYLLTYKSNTIFGEGSWQEVETEISKEVAKMLASFFLANGFTEEVRIIKRRQSCKYNGCEINIDNIKGLGSFIEVEKMSDPKGVEQSKNKILGFLEKIGVNKSQVINKGYVSLMREKYARN